MACMMGLWWLSGELLAAVGEAEESVPAAWPVERGSLEDRLAVLFCIVPFRFVLLGIARVCAALDVPFYCSVVEELEEGRIGTSGAARRIGVQSCTELAYKGTKLSWGVQKVKQMMGKCRRGERCKSDMRLDSKQRSVV